MVRAALKADLRATASKGAGFDEGGGFVVGQRFAHKGGVFWVATDGAAATIIGCVGVG